MTPPFTVLSVCMGNVCRSPMSERLLVARLREHVGDRVDDFVLSHSCGLGGWHAGEGMTAATVTELRERGGSDEGFRSRQITRDMVEISDLILTATDDQIAYIGNTHPEAIPRTFLVRHFGALLPYLDAGALPPFEPTPEAVQKRGVAIVAAADAVREKAPESELDDPWGLDSETYRRIGDELDETLIPFARLLVAA